MSNYAKLLKNIIKIKKIRVGIQKQVLGEMFEKEIYGEIPEGKIPCYKLNPEICKDCRLRQTCYTIYITKYQ